MRLLLERFFVRLARNSLTSLLLLGRLRFVVFFFLRNKKELDFFCVASFKNLRISDCSDGENFLQADFNVRREIRFPDLRFPEEVLVGIFILQCKEINFLKMP